ncbi:hypothetical protein A3Q56_07339 [Intoshia linei]|uniref:HAT C-terminal dimerisation domain-containing protein n=1 Tax=Intoshia linei TaxID=1819745 RepID=A0A177AU97_9BILA|nr:hypothetical protein A3Q56_07339 [Intoshia linei]
MWLNQNDLEIRNEKIFCLRCKNVYPIHKGTLKRHVLTALHSNAPNVLPVLDTDQSSIYRRYPYKFIPISTTRWLVRGKDINPILFEFESMNRKFQSEKADHCRLLVELNNFVKQVMSRIIKIEYNNMAVDFENEHAFKDFDDVDIGYECSCFLEISLSDNKLTESEILAIKKKCRLFLITLIKQLFKSLRVSKNVRISDKIQYVSLSFILNHNKRKSFLMLPLELAEFTKLNIIESQWRSIININWCDELGTDRLPDGSTFWTMVLTYRDSEGVLEFKDLALFVLKVYCIPISNAVVERVFSDLNNVKTEQRNRMEKKMLSSILTIRSTFQATDIYNILNESDESAESDDDSDLIF